MARLIDSIASNDITPLSPTELNALRLPLGHFVVGTFDAVLERSSSNRSLCEPTPQDVQGPYHLPPEEVPDDFPARNQACLLNPSCATCEPYDGGIPLVISGHVLSADTCNPLTGDDVVVDIWQSDPDGVYWDDIGHWQRRQLQELTFNCRAHLSGGSYNFSTLLPGHYVAGNKWRPRHIHIRVQAPGFATLVTQIYFGGDPFLGEADTACSSCKSDHPALIVPLDLQPDNTAWSLCDLAADACAPKPPGSPPLPPFHQPPKPTC